MPLSFWLTCDDDRLIATAVETLTDLEQRNRP